MKPVLKKRFAFIAKSMLWSVLLYVVLMLAFNWDDVSNRVKGTNAITIISNLPSQRSLPDSNPGVMPPAIVHNISTFEKIITIAKAIEHIVGIATR